MQAVSDGTRWMLRLSTDEELLESLGALATAKGIRAAAVPMGIGQLKAARIGYWNGSEYEAREITEPVELVSLQGSIAEADGRPSVHVHAALGTRSHATLSGRLMRGTVGPLAEVLVAPFPTRAFGRPVDESTGLRLLDLEPPAAP